MPGPRKNPEFSAELTPMQGVQAWGIRRHLFRDCGGAPGQRGRSVALVAREAKCGSQTVESAQPQSGATASARCDSPGTHPLPSARPHALIQLSPYDPAPSPALHALQAFPLHNGTKSGRNPLNDRPKVGKDRAGMGAMERVWAEKRQTPHPGQCLARRNVCFIHLVQWVIQAVF